MMMQRILRILVTPQSHHYHRLIPIKYASVHLNALESLKPSEKKMKARKLFIFPLGRI
jgi:hypothetical protein